MNKTILDLIKCDYKQDGEYIIIFSNPAKGILYITEHSPGFISGHVRLRGKNNGSYPYRYLNMIDTIFGKEPNTIEVCSGDMVVNNSNCNTTTVDINPAKNPDIVDDAQVLSSISSDNIYYRWRCDPPYNLATAKSMYGLTDLPQTSKLLKAGARVCRPGSLMFLLLGAQNYQMCPKGVKRIGWIAITIVPNNEIRCLNIFLKKYET
jgi:hypothetical protein